MDVLVKKAIKGDADAFVDLIKENRQSLYKTAWVYLRNEQDIADAVQDTILACYEKIGTLKNTEYFKTWMIRILINKCNDMLRKRSDYDDVADCEIGGTHDEFDSCEWKQLLSCLDRKSRRIVQLYYYEELSINEISEILDMNRNTVMTRLDRARKKLKNEIQ